MQAQQRFRTTLQSQCDGCCQCQKVRENTVGEKRRHKQRTSGCHNTAPTTLALFNEVNRHWARLVLVWVTVYGQVNHLGIWPAQWHSQEFATGGV